MKTDAVAVPRRRWTRLLVAAATLALVAPMVVASPAHSVPVPDAPVPAAGVVTSPVGASTTPEAAYVPADVVVTPGSTLQYSNADTVNHNLSSEEPGLFASDFVGTGQTGEVEGVADLDPGVYDFLCTLHPTMRGTLTVLGDEGGEDPEDPEDPEEPAVEADEDVVYETLVQQTNEPMALDVADDGRVVWTERDGTFSVLPPGSPTPISTQLPVAGNLCEPCVVFDPTYTLERLASDPENAGDSPLGVGGPLEAGLYGVLLDDDFADNDTLYLFYAVPNSDEEVAPGITWGEMRLSSFVLDPTTNLLDLSSEQPLFSVPIEWYNPAHLGGDLDYLPDGTIVLGTGDNVIPTASDGYGARDHRKHYTNAELTSANPAERRGKLLRLREDGSVPDGSRPGEMPNPFIGMEGWNPYIEDSPDNVFVGDRAGTPGDGWIEFDPYVYSLGYKQAWRQVVMPNGDIYVSDVGPDAGSDDPERGPRGFEEISRVPYGGGTHAGWPRCAGPNWAYVDVDWETLETNGPLDCSPDAVIARSIEEPDDAAQVVRGMTGADFYYPGGACDGSQDATYECDQWPIVGTGAKTSEPTVFYPQDVEGPLALPERYRDRMFVLEWSRSFILTIPADPETADLDLDNDEMDLVNPPPYSVNPNLDAPQSSVSAMARGRYLSPIDATIGPDGALYFLEYGATFWVGENGRVSRISGAAPQQAASSTPEQAAAAAARGGGAATAVDAVADGRAAEPSGDAPVPAPQADDPDGTALPATEASADGTPFVPVMLLVGGLLLAAVGPWRRRRFVP